MGSFNDNSPFGLPPDLNDPNSNFPQYEFTDPNAQYLQSQQSQQQPGLRQISLQQIQLQHQPQSPSAASIISNSSNPSQSSSPAGPIKSDRPTYTPIQFYENSLSQAQPGLAPIFGDSSLTHPYTYHPPTTQPSSASSQFHVPPNAAPVFQQPDSSFNSPLNDPQSFNMVFPYAGTPSSASVQEPVLFQHNASTQQQPTAEGPAQVYGYPFQAPLPSSQSTHPALINFQQPVYSQPSTKGGYNPTSHPTNYEAVSSGAGLTPSNISVPIQQAPTSGNRSSVPTGLEVLESNHAKRQSGAHLRIKPHVERGEINKKGSHAGIFSHHSSISAVSVSSSTTSSGASPSGHTSRTAPKFPCPEDWPPLPAEYYSNVPDFYPSVPPSGVQGSSGSGSSTSTATGPTNTDGAATRLDGTDLGFYLETFIEYPRLLYEISTEHGANLFSRKMSWALYEKSGKVYHEFLSGRRLRNTFLHRISRFENRKNNAASDKDKDDPSGSGRKGSRGSDKGTEKSGYRTYSLKIERLLGRILELQNHLRESKVSYYVQKRKAEIIPKDKSDMAVVTATNPATAVITEKSEANVSGSGSSTRSSSKPSTTRLSSVYGSTGGSQRPIEDNSQQTSNVPGQLPDTVTNTFEGISPTNTREITSRLDTSRITEPTDYMSSRVTTNSIGNNSYQTNPENNQDTPMPQENLNTTYSNNNTSAPSIYPNTSGAQQLGQSQNETDDNNQRPQQTSNTNYPSNSQQQQPNFYKCPSPLLHLHPSDPGYYSQIMKIMEAEVRQTIEEAVQKVQKVELAESHERENRYNKRLNEVSTKLVSIEQTVDELKNIVNLLHKDENAAERKLRQQEKGKRNIFDGSFMGDGGNMGNFVSNNTQQSRQQEGNNTIDEQEIEEILRSENNRALAQQHAQRVVKELEEEIQQEKKELEESIAESRSNTQRRIEQQRKLYPVHESDNEHIQGQYKLPESAPTKRLSESPRPSSIHTNSASPVGTKRSSQSPASKGSPAKNPIDMSNLAQLTPSTSNASLFNNTRNPILPVTSSDTGNLSVGRNNGSSVSLGDIDTSLNLNPADSLGQSSNFGLDFLSEFPEPNDRLVQELEGTEDDQDGAPDISECT